MRFSMLQYADADIVCLPVPAATTVTESGQHVGGVVAFPLSEGF